MRKSKTEHNRIKVRRSGGYTLVELIVTFALLGIFLVAVSTAMSSSVRTYYAQRQTMAAYTVADNVLSSIKEDLRTMLGNDNGSVYGYLKIRNKTSDDEVAPEAVVMSDATGVSGNLIEFVRMQEDGTSYAEQIDAYGFNDRWMLKSSSTADTLTTDFPEEYKDGTNLWNGYLTKRYYMMYAKEEASTGYKGLYADKICDGSTLLTNLTTGYPSITLKDHAIAADVEQDLGKNSYQGFTISLNFEVTPETNSNGSISTIDNPNYAQGKAPEAIVKTIKVTVNVLQNDTVRYRKTTYITPQNEVGYISYNQGTGYNKDYSNTMYSDGTAPEVTGGGVIPGTKIKYIDATWPTDFKKNPVDLDGGYNTFYKFIQGTVFKNKNDGKYYLILTPGMDNSSIDNLITNGDNCIVEIKTDKIYSSSDIVDRWGQSVISGFTTGDIFYYQNTYYVYTGYYQYVFTEPDDKNTGLGFFNDNGWHDGNAKQPYWYAPSQ